MATTSGTIGQTQLDVATLLEHAWRRCGRLPSDISPEFAQASRDLLYLLMRKLANDGINLWALEKVLLGLYQGQGTYDLPVGTQRITQLLRREPQRQTSGTPASSDGGTAANAFDVDVDTVCTQTAPNGNLSYDAGTDSTVKIVNVGVMTSGDRTYHLVFETSTDGASWTQVADFGVESYTDSKWLWHDIEAPLDQQYCRIRETGGGVLVIRELYLGTIPVEIPISMVNRDEYMLLSNRTVEGWPNLYWFDRQRDQARVWLWQVPNSTFTWHMVLWRQRQLQDVGTDLNVLDVPERWLPAIISALAADLAEELVPPLNEQTLMRLRARAEQEWSLAAQQETDGSKFVLNPNIGAYTR